MKEALKEKFSLLAVGAMVSLVVFLLGQYTDGFIVDKVFADFKSEVNTAIQLNKAAIKTTSKNIQEIKTDVKWLRNNLYRSRGNE